MGQIFSSSLDEEEEEEEEEDIFAVKFKVINDLNVIEWGENPPKQLVLLGGAFRAFPPSSREKFGAFSGIQKEHELDKAKALAMPEESVRWGLIFPSVARINICSF